MRKIILKGNLTMTSVKYLLHQIRDPQLSINERAMLQCQVARQFEEAGNYDAGCDAMGELWLGIGNRPSLVQLDPRTAADVLLRLGVLTGWIGSTRQIKDAQEIAKNLISESITIFENLPDLKKVAEAQTEIAYCYWREGAMDEARVMLSEALTKLDDRDGDLKAVALLRSALVEKVANRLNDALAILTNAIPLFEVSENPTLKGRFHNEFATVLKNLGLTENRGDYIDRALIEFAAAGFHFEQGGHSRYQACVENNLAMLFLKMNKPIDAHERLDRAQALFTTLDDKVHLAQVEETRARVMLSEGATAKAEKIARAAVRMLENGGEQSLLAEALTTFGIALSRLHYHEEGRQAFERAIEIAEQAGDWDSAGVAALCLVEELFDHLSDDELCNILEHIRGLLKGSQNATSRERLLTCTYRALSRFHAFRPDWSTFCLPETLHRQEARFIRMAFEDADGRISQAARLLGLNGHQSLQFILKGRQRELYELLQPLISKRKVNG